MLKVDRDLTSSFFKTIYIYDDANPDNNSNIVVRKKPVYDAKKVDIDPVWAKVDILIQQQHFAPSYTGFLIEALQVARDEAALLENEYPAGTKLFK